MYNSTCLFVTWERERERGYSQNGSDGLVNPAVLFKQVTDDQAKTKNGHEHRYEKHLWVFLITKVSYIIKHHHSIFVVVPLSSAILISTTTRCDKASKSWNNCEQQKSHAHTEWDWVCWVFVVGTDT